MLFPLESLGNFPASTPAALEVMNEATSGSKAKKRGRGGVQLDDSDDNGASGELDVKAKLRFEFTKIPALVAVKPN